MLISSTQVQLHCRVDFFTYRNLFQNEISDDFSSKSLLKLLIHSNAHIHNYRSRKKRWILELEIWFRLSSSSILLEPHGIVTFDLYLIKFIFNRFIHLDIILIVCSHKILLFSSNYLLVIDRNNLDNISTILLAIQKKNNNFENNGIGGAIFLKKNSATITPIICRYPPACGQSSMTRLLSVAVNAVQ